MEEGKLFQIGDVAKMFHISTGSLRHYEQAGLIQPEYIDPNTGYRYYSIRQFEVLNTIRYLRVLDMPLHQIADFLENRDIEVMEEKLLKQKELVAGKKKELAAIEKKIDHRLQQIRDARNRKLDSIQLIKVPSCRIVWLQDSLKPESISIWNILSGGWKPIRRNLWYFSEKLGWELQKIICLQVGLTIMTVCFLCWMRKTTMWEK